MKRLYLLDAGPLGLISNPKESDDARRCKAWIRAALAAGARVMVAEVTDYEVRRELIRSRKSKGIERLDGLVEQFKTLPTDLRVWRARRMSGRRPGMKGSRRPQTRR